MSQNGFVKSSADTSDKSICEAYPILNDHKSISFLDNIDKCKTDTYILQYFNDTDQDFYEFIKLHIEFDKLINSKNNNISKFDINKELGNIKSILIEQNDKLSQLPFNIKDNLISLENNIRNVSNNDIKLIENMYNEKDLYLELQCCEDEDIEIKHKIQKQLNIIKDLKEINTKALMPTDKNTVINTWLVIKDKSHFLFDDDESLISYIIDKITSYGIKITKDIIDTLQLEDIWYLIDYTESLGKEHNEYIDIQLIRSEGK